MTRITQLQGQGYSLSHASMMAACEWGHEDWGNGAWWCPACGGGDPPVHQGDCPIPALGYAVLREQHWFTREWEASEREQENKCIREKIYTHHSNYKRPMLTKDKRCWLRLGRRGNGWCLRPRGHDSGAHEPNVAEVSKVS